MSSCHSCIAAGRASAHTPSACAAAPAPPPPGAPGSDAPSPATATPPPAPDRASTHDRIPRHPTGCARRSSHTRASTSRDSYHARPTRPVAITAEPPPMHRLSRHAHLGRTSLTRAPSKTAITARYRCSTTDNATSPNPDLPPQSARADHGQRRQACPETQCKASPASGHPPARSREDLYTSGSLRSPPAARLRAAASGRPRRPPRHGTGRA